MVKKQKKSSKDFGICKEKKRVLIS